MSAPQSKNDFWIYLAIAACVILPISLMFIFMNVFGGGSSTSGPNKGGSSDSVAVDTSKKADQDLVSALTLAAFPTKVLPQKAQDLDVISAKISNVLVNINSNANIPKTTKDLAISKIQSAQLDLSNIQQLALSSNTATTDNVTKVSNMMTNIKKNLKEAAGLMGIGTINPNVNIDIKDKALEYANGNNNGAPDANGNFKNPYISFYFDNASFLTKVLTDVAHKSTNGGALFSGTDITIEDILNGNNNLLPIMFPNDSQDYLTLSDLTGKINSSTVLVGDVLVMQVLKQNDSTQVAENQLAIYVGKNASGKDQVVINTRVTSGNNDGKYRLSGPQIDTVTNRINDNDRRLIGVFRPYYGK